MDKQDILESQDIPKELVDEAWEQADGNGERAVELLEPVEITIKGKLSDEDSNLYGLLLVKWDLSNDSPIGIRGVVVNVALTDIQASDSSEAFYKRITELENSSNLLSGYTDSLQQPIQDLLDSSDNDYPEALLEDEIESFTETVRELLTESLDLKDLEVSLATELHRRINKEPEEEEETEDEEDERVNVPSCDVHVTPVEGVAVDKLQRGDMIYVELGEIPEEWSKLKPVLEDLRDDSGLIPAELRSKEQTGDGRMELQVQFGKQVYGTVGCSPDVSLMVPDETREKYDNTQSVDIEDFMDTSVLTVVGVVVLILVLLVLLIG